ncbi:regulatory protein AmpE [Escherichia coli]|nr:regulatory protein AmpE [Escherichia coli]
MSNQFGDTRIDDDLTLLSETLEEVLRSSGRSRRSEIC